MRLKLLDGHVDALGSSDQDKTASVSRISSSRATWQNLTGQTDTTEL